MSTEARYPFMHTAGGGTSNRDWWPHQLNLEILHQHSPLSDPMGKSFDYAKEFESLDLAAVKKDLLPLMTDSQDWWPADFGHYGPFFIRMAWHSAGTYRIGDGCGGASRGSQRLAPLNSWPDNVNLDKARRLLWPIKQKYGRKISWADLMILAGNVALESMGFETFGFGGGREGIWEQERDVYWGVETKWLDDKRYSGDRRLENPLAAVQMGLIYVNPEGPNGNPDPIAAARDIRETFARMAMDDEETVALIAGGHTFGKTHGAGPAADMGPEPEAASIEEQGLGWKSSYRSVRGADAISGGPEVTWTTTPTKWSNNFFENLFGFEWELSKSPAGARQWVAMGAPAAIPDAFDPSVKRVPTMLTTDLSLRFDPAYEKISRRFLAHPDEFARAFARARFKLTHRDMGPRARYLGSEVPAEDLIWQDPIPAVGSRADRCAGHRDAQGQDPGIGPPGLRTRGHRLGLDLHVPRLRPARRRERCPHPPGAPEGLGSQSAGPAVRAAEDPGRHPERLQPRPAGRQEVVALRSDRAGRLRGRRAGGEGGGARCGGAVRSGPHGRVAGADRRATFAALEPLADGFRNYQKGKGGVPAEAMLVDKAQLLTLTAPEMTVLVGGMRVLATNFGGTRHGVFTTRPGALTNDFFVNLLDMSTEWRGFRRMPTCSKVAIGGRAA